MPYTRETIPDDHSEFGGGPGMIDPVLRADRLLLPEQQLWEIYATNQSGGQAVTGTLEEQAAKKAEAIVQSDPAHSIVERP